MELEWYGLFAFTNEIVKKSVENRSGSYLISELEHINEYQPIYVGITQYLVDRLLEHLSSNEENDCIKYKVGHRILRFHCCYVNNEEDRKNIEHTLYKKYIPKCNRDIPKGKEISFTLPR